MRKFAFISRHLPTTSQFNLAAEQGITLIHVGDVDGFQVSRCWVESKGLDFEGVIVVHAAAALRLKSEGYEVGVFENANRAPEGEKPTFEAVGLYVY